MILLQLDIIKLEEYPLLAIIQASGRHPEDS